MSRRLARQIGLPVLLGLVAVGAATLSLYPRRLPKRFAVVEEGRLYRSGEITPAQLACVARQYQLRTVLSLLNPETPESRAERRAAEQLGIHWVNIPLPGDGASTPEERDKIKAVLLDSATAPLLVHCAAGVNRAGLAVGLYRLHQQGWTLEQVLTELRANGSEDSPRHESLRAALRAEAAAISSTRPASSRPAQTPHPVQP